MTLTVPELNKKWVKSNINQDEENIKTTLIEINHQYHQLL